MVEPEPVIESEPIVEPEPIMEQAPAADLSDPNKKMNPDEIAALIASMGAGESEPVTEPEPVAEPELVAEPEPVAEPESNVELEPIEVASTPAPDLSDPNKKMNPDEIAALIASMGAGESEPVAEPEPEPEPIVESEPVVEEKPPMPDLSDPNRTLSPDEIAALIANI